MSQHAFDIDRPFFDPDYASDYASMTLSGCTPVLGQARESTAACWYSFACLPPGMRRPFGDLEPMPPEGMTCASEPTAVRSATLRAHGPQS